MRVAFGDGMGLNGVNVEKCVFISMRRGMNVSLDHLRAEIILCLLSMVSVPQQPYRKFTILHSSVQGWTWIRFQAIYYPKSVSTFP